MSKKKKENNEFEEEVSNDYSEDVKSITTYKNVDKTIKVELTHPDCICIKYNGRFTKIKKGQVMEIDTTFYNELSNYKKFKFKII